MAVPYTGMIISTRESKRCGSGAATGRLADLRRQPHERGRLHRKDAAHDTEQFDVSIRAPWTRSSAGSWTRPPPSFCTACYRAGRTGDRFMEFCKSGQIQDFCQPNALLTLGRVPVRLRQPRGGGRGGR